MVRACVWVAGKFCVILYSYHRPYLSALEMRFLMTDDIAGLDIAGLDIEGLDIDGLDNGGLDIDGLDIAGLDIVGLDIDGLDNDGRMCG